MWSSRRRADGFRASNQTAACSKQLPARAIWRSRHTRPHRIGGRVSCRGFPRRKHVRQNRSARLGDHCSLHSVAVRLRDGPRVDRSRPRSSPAGHRRASRQSRQFFAPSLVRCTKGPRLVREPIPTPPLSFPPRGRRGEARPASPAVRRFDRAAVDRRAPTTASHGTASGSRHRSAHSGFDPESHRSLRRSRRSAISRRILAASAAPA